MILQYMSSIPCASQSFSSKITRLSASCSFSLCLSFSFSIFFPPFLPDVLPKSSNQRIPIVHSDGNLNHTARYLTLQALIFLFLSLPVDNIYRQKQSHPKMTLFLSFSGYGNISAILLHRHFTFCRLAIRCLNSDRCHSCLLCFQFSILIHRYDLFIA